MNHQEVICKAGWMSNKYIYIHPRLDFGRLRRGEAWKFISSATPVVSLSSQTASSRRRRWEWEPPACSVLLLLLLCHQNTICLHDPYTLTVHIRIRNQIACMCVIYWSKHTHTHTFTLDLWHFTTHVIIWEVFLNAVWGHFLLMKLCKPKVFNV